MEGKRIVGEIAEISYESIHTFFEARGNNRQMRHKYNYVLYLDDSPEIAIQRDQYLKRKMDQLLRLSEGMSVLDIGCGIGRMGELFCERGLSYYGMDGSIAMIEMAKRNLENYNDKCLFVGNAQNIEEVLDEQPKRVFDIVFLCGVLMYLNDQDVRSLFDQINRITHDRSQICFIESMSNDKRLTLKDIFSDELKQTYSAIYRSTDEFLSIMDDAFHDKYTLACNEIMDYPDGIQSKREHVTREHCVIWKGKD